MGIRESYTLLFTKKNTERRFFLLPAACIFCDDFQIQKNKSKKTKKISNLKFENAKQGWGSRRTLGDSLNFDGWNVEAKRRRQGSL